MRYNRCLSIFFRIKTYIKLIKCVKPSIELNTKLLDNNLSNSVEDFELCADLFSQIKEIAIKRKDEKLLIHKFYFQGLFLSCFAT